MQKKILENPPRKKDFFNNLLAITMYASYNFNDI